MREAVIVGGAGTGIGRLPGALSELSAAQPGGIVLRASRPGCGQGDALPHRVPAHGRG